MKVDPSKVHMNPNGTHLFCMYSTVFDISKNVSEKWYFLI